jgi:hypothetical protein
MWLRWYFVSLALVVVGCHGWRADENRNVTPGEFCRTCCQQAQDACKMDSDRPGYWCPRDYTECVGACAENNENQMCVVETNRRYAATAPKKLPETAAPPTPATPMPNATASAAPSKDEPGGECDAKGIWNLIIDDTSGRARSCDALDKVPRDLTFRIEQKHHEYAIRDLAPQPGWEDEFHIDSRADQCAVVLTRDNRSDSERPRSMTIELLERAGQVIGTFRYVETMPKPATCELEARIIGQVATPTPQAAPPQSTSPPRPVQPPERLQMPAAPPRK